VKSTSADVIWLTTLDPLTQSAFGLRWKTIVSVPFALLVTVHDWASHEEKLPLIHWNPKLVAYISPTRIVASELVAVNGLRSATDVSIAEPNINVPLELFVLLEFAIALPPYTSFMEFEDTMKTKLAVSITPTVKKSINAFFIFNIKNCNRIYLLKLSHRYIAWVDI
jgi:hypothetical protein